MLMRTLGFASKMKPRVSRGIGHAVTATRHIGTAARHVREIGAAVNGATGNVLQNHPYYNKAMQVVGQVERGAATAAEIGGDIQNRLN